jgi:flagellar biosynthetic protein FliR
MLVQNITDFLSTGVFAFLIVFVRFGTAMMIMPGIGDSFVSAQIRLLIAVSISFCLFPVLMLNLPTPLPGTFALFFLLVSEFIIGLFFGTIARIFMTALDTAGMVISIQSGLGSAQIFNPSLAAQGSLIGALMSMTGVLLLFVTNLHHLLILGLYESYEFFPVGELPDVGSMAEMMALAVAASFAVGVKIAAPFIVITTMINVGMGVLSRLMPQMQVFMTALPLQILLSIITLSLVFSAAFFFWLAQFEEGMVFFLSESGG